MLTSSVFLEFRLAGEDEGLAPFGAGVSVGKFLAVTLNGARVGVRIANVINIFSGSRQQVLTC